MKKLLAAIVATTALTAPVMAQDITEFRIGILGGENAQDRMASNECYRAMAEDLLGVPVKLFTPADYDGVIQGLWEARSTWRGWEHRPMPKPI